MLPSAVWQDYDVKKTPLEDTIISSSVKDGVKIKLFRMTALEAEGGKIISTVAVYNSDADFGRIIVIVPEYHKSPSETLLFDLARAGFTVVVPDVAGNFDPPTTFPEIYRYGRFSEAGDHLKKVSPTARDTSQYLYSIIVKRAVFFVRERIGDLPLALVGLSDGVEVAMQVAGSGTGGDVDALACLNGAGYREYVKLNKYGGGKELEMDEERIAWLAGAASVAYAKYINVPVFIAIGTNGEKSDPDRLQNLASLIPGDKIHTSLSPRAADFILPDAYRTFKIWLSRALSGEAFPDCPKISLRVNEDDKIYAYADCDPASMIEKVTIYYSFGEYNHEIREWFSAGGIAVSFNEYIATVEVTDDKAPLFAFAEVLYENGAALSSLPEYMELSGQPVKVGTRKPSRIIHEASGGVSHFIECSDGEALFERGLSQVVTPAGARGIVSTLGRIKTYHVDSAFPGASDSMLLQFELYSEKSAAAIISVQEKSDAGIKKYSATINISGTEGYFAAAKLKVSDFKDERLMPLQSWSGVRSLSIDAPGVIIGNILFI